MADKYIALKTELDTIAQGLIQKSGSSTTTLTFPDEFTATIAQLVKPTGSIGITSTTAVDVSSKATAYVDADNVENLSAANIITGKTILGVTGSAVVPSGNKDITTTASYDVTEFATAQINDSNLVAANIAKDVTVLGITGTHEGGITPTGTVTITTTGDTDVHTAYYANVPASAIPADKICTGTSILGVAGTFEGIIPSGSIGLSDTSTQDITEYAEAYIDTSNVTNLNANNIVKNVTILGVTGTYEGGGIIPTGTLTIESNGTHNVYNYASAYVNVPGASLTDVNITSNGTYTHSGYDGYDTVTVDVTPSLQSKNITANGTYTPESGYDGFSSVSVDVQGSPTLQEKNVTYTSNGTEDVTPDSGYDGLSKVSITVNVTPSLQTKTVTVNGEVTADSDYDGLEKVIVAIEEFTWD